ncbi:MAG TPA: hypothetical protein VF221_05660 [Chloroflexota bacterium]
MRLIDTAGMLARSYCCHAMKQQIEYRCPTHPNPFDCPDNAVVYVQRFDEYGLPIRNGPNGQAQSYLVFSHCPWCGSALPESKRDRYFEELEARGIDPGDDAVPPEFESDAWWAPSEDV